MQLTISIGQFSDKGCKDIHQDFHGAYIAKDAQLATKGIAIAIADGISSSDVSQIASQTAVTNFLEDYYCTPEAWSVKTSAERVLSAVNSWLFSQTRQSEGRFDKDRGYVCTMSALVLKSTTAHVFHVGDTRIYRLQQNESRPGTLEQLTNDHRVQISPGQSYLSRALGVDSQLEIDYRSIALEAGDYFMLATDGVYEYADKQFLCEAMQTHAGDLDKTARAIVEHALRRGSKDNLTVQLIKVDAVPSPDATELLRQSAGLPLPPLLEAGMEFDGYRIARELHGSHRSHVYLATDMTTDETVVIKTPSVDLRDDPRYLERFLIEDWIARRIRHAHVLEPCATARKRSYIYLCMEYIEGKTLTQWMRDHPKPDLATVRDIIGQTAKGLRAFHRLEMLHQDLRPDNLMIDSSGTVKIIDFGSARVAGIHEIENPGQDQDGAMPGTAQYAAPEYFLGEGGTPQSDVFSLGVIAYQMLTGRLPYGAQVARATTRAAQRKLAYNSARIVDRSIPAWVDEAIRKAVHPQPDKRYTDALEFLSDLHHPNTAFLNRARPPLIERDPVVFWKGVSLFLALVLLLIGIRSTLT
ncbi:MAG: protein kinase domain-containing protein [Burkholderiaceae bacterium]